MMLLNVRIVIPAVNLAVKAKPQTVSVYQMSAEQVNTGTRVCRIVNFVNPSVIAVLINKPVMSAIMVSMTILRVMTTCKMKIWSANPAWQAASFVTLKLLLTYVICAL